MRKYRFKRGYPPKEDRLEEMLTKYFNGFEKDNGVYIIRSDAFRELKMWFEGKLLCVESTPNPDVDEKKALEVVRTYNKFLEELTGYTAKERRKHMQKEVEK
jgi:hypothetical protein